LRAFERSDFFIFICVHHRASLFHGTSTELCEIREEPKIKAGELDR
jgi:hypothetical protein